MLVHLGDGYFVNLNCIVGIFPKLNEKEQFTELGVSFSDGRIMHIPYYLKNRLVEEIDKLNRSSLSYTTGTCLL